ncbi:NAD(P)-binding protein [Laetiporus sulphureus 93-53]|uniref:D-xylose 1-dehydrogenase (NADP(+), D-xylono-1,5-lactone-forming) n=1 Tax=Laetiporus sulphureus 93-53 TaxID=1314785 RepID=A0A165GA62_9APHY|nr:NAD(P)-binding protein [Laetiporus sulphureus 93-53]KZT10056.1 NAD(P)-binding protein [Laetiporus sulphureus 93-53]
MALSNPFVLRWGVISTGRIAMEFVKDCSIDPLTRGTTDVVHKVIAVGSRHGNVQKAVDFIKAYGAGQPIKAYGTYEDVFADKDVDAIYIGSPHTQHYENALAALLAGKHVLCEKATTSNAAELRHLLSVAKQKQLFFMEAMWTRFQPLTKEVKRIAEEGTLGDPVVLHADLSHDFDIEDIPTSHRIIDPRLGGGALLDLGPYPLFWTVLALYDHPKNQKEKPTSISASMIKTPITGVDSSTAWSVNFTKTLRAQAILSCSITVPTAHFGVTIRYRNGNIIIGTPIFKPTSFTVQYFDKPGSGVIIREEKRVFHYVGGGWHFEADEVARCVRDGKLESELWGHDKSLLLMETFDEVRRQGGYKLPDGVEKVL